MSLATPRVDSSIGDRMSYVDPCPPPVINKPFKIEAIVICDKYDDFLRYTLPNNKHLFDKIVVVTSFEDKATRRMCEFHHVECITTDRLESRKGKFCKGAGINDGLAKLDKDGWVVHLDADIWLPPQTRILLGMAELDRRMVYGIDRFIVRGPEAWEKFLEAPKLQHEDETYIHMTAFPIGTRVMHKHEDGYLPIGFFQMWSPSVSGVTTYPEGHSDAGREDTDFVKQWPRSNRAMIPEIVGYHLESVDAGNASNWSGRTTAPFTR
jgi:hypothetical protein